MPYSKSFSARKDSSVSNLSRGEMFSVFYHNLFEYPLTFSETIRWVAKNPPEIRVGIKYKNGYYFVEGEEGLIYKRALRERISQKKMLIAKKASRIISMIPSVKMLGITGSLAMNNATAGSDIDVIIITKRGKLWSTRFFTYLLLKILNIEVRKPGKSSQKDKLCMNMWLDETDLVWPTGKRNIYTAHEILQIIPIINRENTYERFLFKNKWSLKYWPNAQKIKNIKNTTKPAKLTKLPLIEHFFYKMQFLYLKPKMTKEYVSFSRAVFHPRDLSKEVAKNIYLTGKT